VIRFVWKMLKEVAGLFLLLLTLLVSVLFQLTREIDAAAFRYPDNDPKSKAYFPFSEVELYRDTFYHYLMIYSIAFILSLYIWINATKHHTALLIFTLIHFVALIDYRLNYNETWFEIGVYPISWNILKVVIFTLAIINECLLMVEKRWKDSLDT
jgi:hypothetical protein